MAESANPPELNLYVRSMRAVANFYRPPPGTLGGAPQPSVGQAGVSGADTRIASESAIADDTPVHFLSDDQARCVALSEEIAARRGYRILVTDVSKAGRLERLVTEHLRGVQTFPVLLAPTGRLEGIEAFTEERLCELMPTEMQGIRAFSYLKIRGGNLERTRQALVVFPEVKELHLLTGDWDIFVVLQFSQRGSGGKRQVLDFVTERIRTLPDIVDTSTLVPEYSTTKFAQQAP